MKNEVILELTDDVKQFILSENLFNKRSIYKKKKSEYKILI